MYIKIDCFALNDESKCIVLEKINCKNCNFYKTKEQHIKDMNIKKELPKCFAQISKYMCKILIEKKCDNCKFRKSDMQYWEDCNKYPKRKGFYEQIIKTMF